MSPQELVTRSHLNELIENVIADKSAGTQRKYAERLRHFGTWLQGQQAQAKENGQDAPAIDKRMMARYKKQLAAEHKSASTINGHLTAVRQLLIEAADMDLIDTRQAERAASVKGVKQLGQRAGNWLDKREAQALLDAPDLETLKGLRDRAILGVLLFCGLRRSEIASLRISHLQMLEGHNVIKDLIGKGHRIRTIKLPVGVKRAIDAWLQASGRALSSDSLVFVAMRKGDKISEGEHLTDQAIYNLIRAYGTAIGHPELAAHDTRRTFAELARKGGAPLDDISHDLGHASIATTQRYLHYELNLEDSATDRVGLRMAALTIA